MFVSNNMFVVNGDNGNLPSGQILHELGYKNEHHELPNTQIHENRSLEIIESTHDPDRNIGADRSGSGPVAIPYKINMEMDVMNNDILDLSKPIRGYPLRKGVSNISLDSLNDNYMDTVDTLKTMSQGSGSREGSLENLLELSRTIQDYHTAEQFSEFERWNNLVNLKKSATNYVADDLHCDTASEDTNFVDLANSEGPCLETARESLAKKEPLFFGDFNQTQKCRSISSQIHHQLYGPLLHSAPVENSFSNSTMSITTTSSLKSADFASSPESYEMLYKSFEIAAYMDEEDRKQGRQLSPSVPNIEMLSPKLQRLRQMCDGMPTSPKPNFCSHRESLERFEEEEAKAELASRKVTFADLAQQKKKQEQEEVRPQSLPFQPSQHWTELLSSSRTPDYAMQFHQTDGLSPRRPHTLPIGLRHVTKPSSRPFPKDVTPECVKSQENVHCDKLESRVSRTFSAPEGFTQYNQDYGVKNENDNMYHCFEKPAFFSTSCDSLTEVDNSNNNNYNGFLENGIVKHTIKKIPPLNFPENISLPPPPLPPLSFPAFEDDFSNCNLFLNMQDSNSIETRDEAENTCVVRISRGTTVSSAEFMKPMKVGLHRIDSLEEEEEEDEESIAVATQTEPTTTDEGTQTIKKRVTIVLPRNGEKENKTLKSTPKLKTKTEGKTQRKETDTETVFTSGINNFASNSAFYAAENCNPVKVKQSQKNQILEQDLLGEVVYVQNKPLKPIYMVDADYNRRKGLSPPPGLISAPVPIPLPQPITGCQKPALPPSIDYADPPTFFGYDVPPIDIPISAYEEFDNCIEIDISQKKGFVSAMNCAVDIVVNHFGKTRDPLEKRKLGDTECTPDIGHMILQYVCPGIASILTDGLQPYGRSVIVGRIKNNIWNVVEATTKLGPGTKQLNDVVAHIINLKNLTDSMVKFNAFIFGLLNTGCLEQWLLHLNSREDILDGFYKPDAFLVLCKSPLKQLFDDLVLAILPLTILPFKLDYKFEYNYIQEMKLRDKGKQKLQEEFEKANTFSPFQLMKKMTQKTRQKIAQSSKQGCTMPDNFSASDANSGAGGGWSVGWMKSLVSSGCKEDDVSQKYPPITASPVKKGMCLPRLKVDTSSKMDQTPKWSLFGPSVAKALNNIKDDTPTLGMKSILSLTPRSRRRMLGKEKAIPDHFAEELMGPRPDPAGSSDGYSSSPEWNISCTRKVLVRRKTRSKTARVV
ncbi:uncharacterized protein LOC102802905 [Saccoglossus kowalevskii]